MAKSRKKPAGAAAEAGPLSIKRRTGGEIWSPVRQRWLVEKPEETVRQDFLCVLVNEYGYSLDQIGEEWDMTGRGSAQARADHVVWRVRKDKLPGCLEEIESIPPANAMHKQIDEILQRLKVFKEDEFADLLHRCHNRIRNRDPLEPTAGQWLATAHDKLERPLRGQPPMEAS